MTCTDYTHMLRNKLANQQRNVYVCIIIYNYDYVIMYLCMQPWVQLQKANYSFNYSICCNQWSITITMKAQKC